MRVIYAQITLVAVRRDAQRVCAISVILITESILIIDFFSIFVF